MVPGNFTGKIVEPSELLRRLARIAREPLGRVRWEEPLFAHSSWRIGGPAALFLEPATESHIAKAISLAHDASVPVVIIGDGTNLLFDDSGIRGIVLKLGRSFGAFEVVGQKITLQAGAWVPRLARASAVAGLTGLEHTIGIPGTVGGLIWMNGGSMRKEISESVRSVRFMGVDGKIQTFDRQDCNFSRRSSVFQHLPGVIVGAKLECKKGDPYQIKLKMLSILRDRRHKFPRKTPNCGSVFVSGGELFSTFGAPGKVIEDLGLKGLMRGDAQVSLRHGNFFLNVGNARSSDMLELIRIVRQKVLERTGIAMNCEVRYVSPDGCVMPAHEYFTRYAEVGPGSESGSNSRRKCSEMLEK